MARGLHRAQREEGRGQRECQRGATVAGGHPAGALRRPLGGKALAPSCWREQGQRRPQCFWVHQRRAGAQCPPMAAPCGVPLMRPEKTARTPLSSTAEAASAAKLTLVPAQGRERTWGEGRQWGHGARKAGRERVGCTCSSVLRVLWGGWVPGAGELGRTKIWRRGACRDLLGRSALLLTWGVRQGQSPERAPQPPALPLPCLPPHCKSGAAPALLAHRPARRAYHTASRCSRDAAQRGGDWGWAQSPRTRPVVRGPGKGGSQCVLPVG